MHVELQILVTPKSNGQPHDLNNRTEDIAVI